MKINLNVKVEEHTRNEIVRLAEEEGITPSEYARNILNDYIGYLDEDDDFINEVNHLGTVTIDCYSTFHKDKEFILLLNWLYYKGLFPDTTDNDAFVTYIKSLLEKAMLDYGFSNDLRFEFLKVLNDINRYLVEVDAHSKQFYFCRQSNMYTFSYNMFFAEVWRISKTN